jgi:CBS domain-containing protein
MKVSEAMAKTIRTVAPGDSVKQVATIMRQEDTGFVPVTRDGALLGAITDRDLVVRCIADGHDINSETVEHCMSRDIQSIEADADIEKAAEIMSDLEVRRLPVMQDGRLVGVLSHGNLVQATSGQGPAKEATIGVTRGA